jgi:hypothetical protein
VAPSVASPLLMVEPPCGGRYSHALTWKARRIIRSAGASTADRVAGQLHLPLWHQPPGGWASRWYTTKARKNTTIKIIARSKDTAGAEARAAPFRSENDGEQVNDRGDLAMAERRVGSFQTPGKGKGVRIFGRLRARQSWGASFPRS